jgi:hypothetical protein
VLEKTVAVLRENHYDPNMEVEESILKTVLSTMGIWDRILRESVEEIDSSLTSTIDEKLVVFIRQANAQGKRAQGASLLHALIDSFSKRTE